MEAPLIHEVKYKKYSKKYEFYKKSKNFYLYKDLSNGAIECFTEFDLGLQDNTKIDEFLHKKVENEIIVLDTWDNSREVYSTVEDAIKATETNRTTFKNCYDEGRLIKHRFFVEKYALKREEFSDV